MGGCLSKSGKKPKDDLDRTPYSPSEKKDFPGQSRDENNDVTKAAAAAGDPAEVTAGENAAVAAPSTAVKVEDVKVKVNLKDTAADVQRHLGAGKHGDVREAEAGPSSRVSAGSSEAAARRAVAGTHKMAGDEKTAGTRNNATESVPGEAPSSTVSETKLPPQPEVVTGSRAQTESAPTQKTAAVAEKTAGKRDEPASVSSSSRAISLNGHASDGPAAVEKHKDSPDGGADIKISDVRADVSGGGKVQKPDVLEDEQSAKSDSPCQSDMAGMRKRASVETPTSVNIRRVSFSDDPAKAMAMARQHVTADVIVTNSADTTEQAEEEEVFNDDQETSPDADESKTFDEPVPIANLKKRVKEILCDFSERNKNIINTKEYVLNTRQKHVHFVQRWVTGDQLEKSVTSQKRALLFSGAPGSGKTCLAAELCRRYEGRLAACHFFDHLSENTLHNDPRCVVLSVAHSFLDVFPNYISTLPRLDRLEGLARAGTLRDLFSALIKAPLEHPALGHDDTKPVLLVLDAVDETADARNTEFLNLINDFTEVCPTWLFLILTAENNTKVLNQLDKTLIHELKPNQENTSDIKRYLKEPMSRFMDRISLDGGLAVLAKKTEGSFLCAYGYRCALEKIPTKSVALRHVDDLLPTGLPALLTLHFKAFRDALGNLDNGALTAGDMYQAILAPLLVANEPLPVDYLLDAVRVEFNDLKDILEPISGFVVLNEGLSLACAHTAIADWLTSEEAGELVVDVTKGREIMSNFCMRWLCTVFAEDGQTTEPLEEYSLRHVVYHLLEQPRKQDDVGKVLSSLRYVQQKLQTKGINAQSIMNDYEHVHYMKYSASNKKVSLHDYIAKNVDVLRAVENTYRFLREKEAEIAQSEGCLIQIAANYTNDERIKNNARTELAGRPWMEDCLASPETKVKVVTVGGHIRGIDISPDGKVIAIVSKDEDYNIKLHLLQSESLTAVCQPVEIRSLKDRYGLVTKFLPDGSNIFVGSLSSFVNVKGKVVASSYDMMSVNMAEKYSIECCDVSSKHLVLGLTTFPWGGRSLHLTVFDIRSKKAAKTIEIIRFQYGGSGQFGVKAVALCKVKPVMAACVRQSNKKQLKVTVWNTTKFQILQSVDVFDEDVSKCLFLNEDFLVAGSGVRTFQMNKSEPQFVPVKSQIWNYSQKGACAAWNAEEKSSVFSAAANSYACARWSAANDNVLVNVWSGAYKDECCKQYKLRGLRDARDVVFNGTQLAFVSSESIHLYDVTDLEDVTSLGTGGPCDIKELIADGVCFLPRGDTFLVVERKETSCSVTTWAAMADDVTQMSTHLSTPCARPRRTSDAVGLYKCFRGPGSALEACQVSSDGKFVVINLQEEVKVWERATGNTASVPSYADVEPDAKSPSEGRMQMVTSPKENVLAVVYQQASDVIYLFDVNTRALLRKMSDNEGSQTISDMIFLPSTNHIITFHKQPSSSILVWNSRAGSVISRQTVPVTYVKVSPASDRLVMSVRTNKMEGEIRLRNADLTFEMTLPVASVVGNHGDTPVPTTWLASNEDGDLEFAADGTVLIAVCHQQGVCRVYNAANGDVLNDIGFTFSGPTEVIGMPTNTHILFYDDRLVCIDVGTADVVTVLPLEDALARRATRRGVRLSPKGALLVGTKDAGYLCVIRLNHFSTVRRKTTLQRMRAMNTPDKTRVPTPVSPTSPTLCVPDV